MTTLSVSDLARNYQLRNQNVQLKTSLSSLTEEVTTGLKSDIGSAVSGDYRALSSINSALARMDVYSQTGAKASLFLSSMQSALSDIQSTGANVASALLATGTNTTSQVLDNGLAQAKDGLTSVLSNLNTTVAGRYVFSGIAGEVSSVGTVDGLLAALSGLTQGMTDADEIALAVDTWFDTPPGGGGYRDTIYQGSESAVSGMKVSDTTTVSLSVTAADSSIRDVLKGLALAAIASGGAGYSDDLKLDLAARSAQKLLSADTGLVETQTRLGVAEHAVETAGARNNAEKTSLNTARNGLIGADPYESATALQAVQTQLKTVYTLTSQLSGMSLVNYL